MLIDDESIAVACGRWLGDVTRTSDDAVEVSKNGENE